MKKAAIIIATAAVAIGIILFASAFILSGFDMSKFGSASRVTNTYTVEEAFDRIEISSEETDIKFKPSEDGRCGVVCVERDKVRHTVLVQDGVLKITADDQRDWFDHLSIFSFSKELSMTVYLPADRYEALTVDCHTGDVFVPEAFSFGSAEITASTGDVTFRGSVSGLLKITASTGDIVADGISAGEASFSVSTGHIEVSSLACNGAVSTSFSTGKIRLTDVTCASLSANGTTGSITLKNVLASGAFDIETSTGDITFDRCDAAELTVKASTGDVTGSLRSEKVFLVKTSTGDVEVPETITGGKCQITTSTGDVHIELSRG